MDHLFDFALGAGLVAIVAALAFTVYVYRTRLSAVRRKAKQFQRLYEAERGTVREQSKRIVQLESHGERRDREIANMRRVLGSPLYRESLESKQVAISQTALRLRVADEEIRTALDILNVDNVFTGKESNQ